MSLGNVSKVRIFEGGEGTNSCRALGLSTGAGLIFLYMCQFVGDFSIYEQRLGYMYRVLD